MPQVRQLVAQDELRRVGLHHVFGQIDRRDQPREAGRGNAARGVDADAAAPAEEAAAPAQPDGKDQPRKKQPEAEQDAAAEPDHEDRLGHERHRCRRFCRLLRLGGGLLRGRLRLRSGLRGLLRGGRGLRRCFGLLYRCCLLRRQQRQGVCGPRQAELQQHHQPEGVEQPLRHAVFERRAHQQHGRDQRRERQSVFQHVSPPAAPQRPEWPSAPGSPARTVRRGRRDWRPSARRSRRRPS